MNLDMKKMFEGIEEQIKQQADAWIEEKVEKYLDECDFEELISDIVERKADKLFFDGDDKLEDVMIKTTGKELFAWYENNIDNETIVDCIKEATIEKFKELDLNQLIEMAKLVK